MARDEILAEQRAIARAERARRHAVCLPAAEASTATGIDGALLNNPARSAPRSTRPLVELERGRAESLARRLRAVRQEYM